MKRVVCWIAVSVLAVAACRKNESSSGALAGAELDLFRNVPAGNNLVFGGSYAKLQNFMQRSAVGRMSKDAAESVGGKALADWLQCFADMANLKFAGGARFGGSGGELRMVMTGVGVAEITACAAKSQFKAIPDADGKFLAVEMPGPSGPMTGGYLLIGDRTLYTRAAVNLAGGTAVSASRAELEADIASAKQKSVATDSALQSTIAKVDRTKTVWFAGNAANTPLADKIGEVYGAIAIESGFGLDVMVQFTDEQLQEMIETNIDQVKRMSDSAKEPAMKRLVDNLDARRIGDRMRITLQVSDADADAFFNTLGGMNGGPF